MTLKDDVEDLKRKVAQMEIEMQRMERDIAMLLRERERPFRLVPEPPYREPYTLMGKPQAVGPMRLPDPVGPMTLVPPEGHVSLDPERSRTGRKFSKTGYGSK